ncbi:MULTISPECIES: TetR/AcrR family transcriptional regulator [unclassified Streptomyces]|uniref:TetR/AcrR family transcriptional regulator n=1 Tax=unclassified Streptomyces TaxID=2593676 RepID=UPI002DDA2054|nr:MULTISPECIES: TetR/AcrR family transcriptional regulator [unclassified Streptomyces]WSA94285.1 TetR/AcrR family transcriptional regulator [Streptomyces sp. NBC_01795]WSB78702.1 TetR/AcrR family transcriptional regulator [Streptomyces sp. NBC_01775]WSS13093.1 TetR/AcrR family transcriptional regulator [Streptomyces sp. NBC_01186]WSS41877.1 TetR/AcrR family transcriptional regulator [Streptomyces sp. NBC_01187]
MSNEKGPDHSRRKERSRQAIFAATRALVAEEAYEKVTVEAIAARAGVGKQTIYRRWPSKSAVVFAALLALSEDADGQSVALPDTGDLRADLKLVMRATAEEFADPSFDRLIRALNTEIANDAALAAEYREKLAQPLEEAKKARLRSAQEAGQLGPDADLDLVLEVLYAPLFRRWLHRSGPLTAAYADSLVDATLRAFGP